MESNQFSSDKAEIHKAALLLGESIANSPVYAEFLTTLQTVNNDPEVQRIGGLLREIQSRAQWGRQTPEQLQELQQLSQELEELAVVGAYRLAESAFRDLLVEVNQTISERIGVDFSANSKCSGGCCG